MDWNGSQRKQSSCLWWAIQVVHTKSIRQHTRGTEMELQGPRQEYQKRTPSLSPAVSGWGWGDGGFTTVQRHTVANPDCMAQSPHPPPTSTMHSLPLLSIVRSRLLFQRSGDAALPAPTLKWSWRVWAARMCRGARQVAEGARAPIIPMPQASVVD